MKWDTACGLTHLCLSLPSAKISEVKEEQEDPYLNDRCRGATPLPPEGCLLVT